MAGSKDEFPPLLPLGFHRMPLTGVRSLCVDDPRFRLSKTRVAIMDGLDAVMIQLSQSGLSAECWIDGSFMTEKLDPEDSDVVVRVIGEEFDNATQRQKQAFLWAATTDLKPGFLCDFYAFSEYALGHALYHDGQWSRAYWLRQFGFSRQDDPKGLAVVKLPLVTP